MNAHIIKNVHRILKGDVAFSLDSHLIFVLQLLSWLKLSQDNQLDGELSFENVVSASRAITPAQLEEYFDKLAKDEKIGPNRLGFQERSSLHSEINPATLATLLDHLRSAYTSKIIDYEAVIWEMGKYASKRPDLGLIPAGVAGLLVDVAQINSSDQIYCPFLQSYNVALLSARQSDCVFSEDKLQSAYPYLVNILCAVKITHNISDPIESPAWVENGQLKQFDRAITFPPLGVRYRNGPVDLFDRFSGRSLYGDVLHIQHCLAQTKRRVVIAVQNGFLFRTSAGERELKKYLVDNGNLEAVIALPAGLLRNTTIPIALLVLDKESETKEDTIVIDASSDHFFETTRGGNVLANSHEIIELFAQRKASRYSEIIPAEQFREQSFNLLPNRYVLSAEQKWLHHILESNPVVNLESIATLIRPQSVRAKKDGMEDFREVMLSDIPNTGYISKPEREISIEANQIERAEQLQLKPLDILLSIKGTIGKVGILPSEFQGKWLAGQSFQVIRLKPDTQIVDPHVLYMYLKSEIGNQLLKSKAAGTAVQMVQTRDVRNMKIIVLPIEQQKKIIESFQEEIELQKEIDHLQNNLNAIKDKFWTQ